MGRVQNKVALVTGGASGIELSAASLLAKVGAKQVAQNIQNEGGEALVVFLDAGNEQSIKDAIDFTVEQFGTITILYNNVGSTNLQKDLDVVNIDLDKWDRLMNVNAKSVFLEPLCNSTYAKSGR